MKKDWKRARRGQARPRDFNRKRYGNPMFPRNRGSKRGPSAEDIKRWGIALLALAAAAAVAWYLFWSPSFRITEVAVDGATPETDAAIREIVDARLGDRRWLLFPQRSVFAFDTDALRRDIEAKFYLERLDLGKKMPRTLHIEVGERSVVAALVVGSGFAALDETGTVVRDLTSRESFALDDMPDSMQTVVAGELGAESVDLEEFRDGEPDPSELKRNRNPYPLIILKDMPADGYAPGERAVSTSGLSTALQAYSRLPDLAGSGVRWFVLDDTAESVEAVLREGWSVYLSTVIPFDLQGERLALVLKEKVAGRRAQLDYVDLRYDERIFFRFRGEERQ